MGAFIIRRLLLLIPLLLGVSIIVFAMIHAIPGDPTQILIGTDQQISDEQREIIRQQYGIDQPLPVQYGKWIGRVLQGDLGTSIRTRRALTYELRLRLPVTIELTLLAGILGTIPAVAVGVLAAVRRNSRLDYGATVATLIGISVPNFLLATLLVLLFSVKLKWLPPIGFIPFRVDPVQNLKVMIMPAISLALPLAAILMRNTRSAVLEALTSDHVRVARAKGLGEWVVIMSHAARNALIPLITVVALTLPALLGGTVIIETIFAWPGMGQLSISAVRNRDYPMIMALNMFIATLILLSNLLADLLYAVADPRIKYD